MAKIVVIGSCNIDITVECDRWPKPGETIFGSRLTVSPGGKGANQAVAAARLGAQVVMVGCIGDDVYGQLVQKALADNNIDSRYVKVLPGESSGTAHITVAEDDNNIIVIKAANDLVAPEHVDAAWEEIKTADMVLLQHEIPFATIGYAIEKCAAAGVPVLLNPAPVAPVPAGLLEKVTYLTPNEHEAAILFDGEDAGSILRRMEGKVIMTLGSRGVAYCETAKCTMCPPSKYARWIPPAQAIPLTALLPWPAPTAWAWPKASASPTPQPRFPCRSWAPRAVCLILKK